MPVAHTKRKRPLTSYTISPEAIAAVAELAKYEGCSKSAVVERLIRREARAQGLDLEALGNAERKKRRLPGGAARGTAGGGGAT
jgi:hypothetical protein